jgi:hypothetical protein
MEERSGIHRKNMNEEDKGARVRERVAGEREGGNEAGKTRRRRRRTKARKD